MRNDRHDSTGGVPGYPDRRGGGDGVEGEAMTEEDFETLVDKFWKLAEDGERGAGDAYNAILAAFAELRAERDLLREAVKRVEFVYTSDGEYGCPWCGEFSPPWDTDNPEHAPDCLRQRALAGKEAQPTNEAAPGVVINTDIEEG